MGIVKTIKLPDGTSVDICPEMFIESSTSSQMKILDQTYVYKNRLTITIGCVDAVVNTGLTEAQIFALTGSLYGKLYLASDTGKYWRRKNTQTTASSANWRNDTTACTNSLALANQLTTEDAVYIRINLQNSYYTRLPKFFVEGAYDNICGSTSIVGFCRQQNQFEFTSCSYNGNNLLGIYQPTANTNIYVFKFKKYGSTYGADANYNVVPVIYYNYSHASTESTIEFIGKDHADYNTVKAYNYVTVPVYGIKGTAIQQDLIPSANNTYNLGNTTYKWKNVYAGTLYEDGSTALSSKYVAKTLTSAKGDIIYASAANTPDRLAIGSSGKFLKSDGTVPKWSTVSVKEYDATATGRIAVLKDVTYTSPSVSGTATAVTGINGGSGSFTPTTKYLGITYTAGTAITGSTPKYMHWSAGSVPTKTDKTVVTGFTVTPTMDFNTGNSGDNQYVTDVSSSSASGTPTTKYLHPSTTSAITGISGGGATTKYLRLSTATAVTGINGGSATTKYLHPSTTSVITGISGGGATTKYLRKTTATAVTGITAGSGTTRYLHSATTNVVTGVSGGSGTMYGSRTVTGSGSTARRSLSVNHTHTGASASGTIAAVTGLSAATTSSTGDITYLQSYTSASASGTATVISGLSVNSTSATGDITYLESHTPASSTGDATVVTGLTAASSASTGDITYLESHTAASASSTATFVSGITSQSSQNTGDITYLESHTAASSTGTATVMTGISAATTSTTGDITYLESYSVSGGKATPTYRYMKYTSPSLNTESIGTITNVGSAPSLVFNSESSGGEKYISALSSGGVGGSVGLTENDATATGRIQYLKSATHSHTGASISSTATVATGISGGSLTKTNTYLTVEGD